MAPRVIRSIEDLRALLGKRIGSSDWVEVTQEQVQKFADATGDHQWIHCDPERAKLESPFGVAIAHGFLTLSLAPVLAQQISTFEGLRMAVNYGLNRVRFPNAVKVGCRLRMHSDLVDLKDVPGGVQATYKQVFEVEGEKKPACVAETMARLYF